MHVAATVPVGFWSYSIGFVVLSSVHGHGVAYHFLDHVMRMERNEIVGFFSVPPCCCFQVVLLPLFSALNPSFGVKFAQIGRKDSLASILAGNDLSKNFDLVRCRCWVVGDCPCRCWNFLLRSKEYYHFQYAYGWLAAVHLSSIVSLRYFSRPVGYVFSHLEHARPSRFGSTARLCLGPVSTRRLFQLSKLRMHRIQYWIQVDGH
mmetsp:Transcript_43502/g.105455  ORF Transcript_43502/g.105455 Transcript_43502/m.105455 type:complete len:205 (-) Transcript_43502:3149-3763(-)